MAEEIKSESSVIVESQVWSAAEIAEFPSGLVMNIVMFEYKRGNNKKVISLLQEYDNVSKGKDRGHGFTGLIKDFKNAVVEKNDTEMLSILPRVAPDLFGAANNSASGGVCVAVLTNNMTMLSTLLEAGSIVDKMGNYEAEKLAAKNGIPDISRRMLKTHYDGEDYASKSALCWAIATRNAKAVELLLKYSPELPMRQTTTVQLKGSRGAYKGSKTVDSENAWDSAMHEEMPEMAQIIFNHKEFKPLILKSIKDNLSQHTKLSWLYLLNSEQKNEIWKSLEIEFEANKDAFNSLNSVWLESGAIFRKALMEHAPEKYIEYYKKFGINTLSYGYKRAFGREPPPSINHVDLHNALKSGSLEVVRFLVKEKPEWLSEKEEYYPGKTRATKRYKGPLAIALLSTQSSVAEYLSGFREIYESEYPQIENMIKNEVLIKGDYHLSQDDANKKEIDIKNIWDKIKLKRSIDASDGEMSDTLSIDVKNKKTAL